MPNLQQTWAWALNIWWLSNMNDAFTWNLDMKVSNIALEQQVNQTTQPSMSTDEFYDIINNAIGSWDYADTSDEEVYYGMMQSMYMDWVNVDWIDMKKELEDTWRIPKILAWAWVWATIWLWYTSPEDLGIVESDKITIGSAIANIGDAFDVVTSWVAQAWINVYNAAENTTEALFRMWDKVTFVWANKIRELIWKEPLTEEQSKSIWWDIWWLDTTIQEDLLDVWQWSLQLWLTSYFPVATLWFNIAWETKEWEKVLQSIGWAIEIWWRFMAMVPWLSDYRKSLPENRRADFDAFVWQSVTLWLFKAWSKLKDIKTKWEQANETAWKILRPTKGEVKTLLQSWEQGIQIIAKEIWKDIKDFKALSDAIKPIKTKKFEPLKKWLEEAQANLIKAEKTWLKWLTKDSSVKWALDQLKDVFEWVSSKELQTIQKEVTNLSKKHKTKWLTLNELQRVKQLHTESNKLFTDKGVIRWQTISSADLQWVRSDIKILIENRAVEWWFKDVQKINTEYWQILSAELLIKERVAEVKASRLKTEVPWIIEKVTWLILELPVVEQVLTKPWQAIFNKLNRWNVGKTISIVELEAQLPWLLKELKNSWEPIWNISKLMKELKSTYPALIEVSVNEL